MTLIEDSQERQSECVHLLYKDSSCVGSDIGIGSWSVSTYTYCMSTVDRKNFAVKIILWLRPTAKIKHAKNKITWG